MSQQVETWKFQRSKGHGAASDVITHIKSEDNLSDLMTKVTHGAKHHRLVGNILYDIYDDHPKP